MNKLIRTTTKVGENVEKGKRKITKTKEARTPEDGSDEKETCKEEHSGSGNPRKN